MNYLRIMDGISDETGKMVGWLLLPMTALLVYAVVMRYFFKNPVVWAHESSLFLSASLGLLAGAPTLLHKGHIRVDVISGRLSPRKQAVLEVITGLLFFCPYCSLVGWFGLKGALRAIAMHETSASLWAPVLWPIKLTIPIAALCLLIQWVAGFIRDLHLAIYGGELP